MRRAFTLVEMLVVIAILGILVALLLLTISATKAKAQRTECLNNLRQISLGIRSYSDDSSDATPSPGGPSKGSQINLSLYSGYKKLMGNYVGVNGASSTNARLFNCPADKFYPDFFAVGKPSYQYLRQSLHDQSYFDHSSYGFNGGDNNSRTFGKTNYFELPGLSGVKLSSIKHPDHTVLLSEASAFAPWSWHDSDLKRPVFNDARNMVGFVDGHVHYVKIYWDKAKFDAGISFALNYDPPAGYDYQWSGN